MRNSSFPAQVAIEAWEWACGAAHRLHARAARRVMVAVVVVVAVCAGCCGGGR
jgi:hypothetical protein